jgi:hypothetical protein
MVTPIRWSEIGAVFGLLAVASGCRDLPETGQASGAPADPVVHEQLVFVYDRSQSIQAHELEHAQELTRERLRSLEHGDRVVALELLELALTEEPVRWATQVPDREFTEQVVPRDSIAKARFIQDVQDYITRFSEPAGRENIGGTDILSTLHLVEAEMQAQPNHRTTLVLFSDMLQANRVMNLEGLTRMPDENWIQDQAARGTLPNLNGLCVVMVGPREDEPMFQVVKDFWQKYFEVTGATFLDQNYNYRPVSIPKHPC